MLKCLKWRLWCFLFSRVLAWTQWDNTQRVSAAVPGECSVMSDIAAVTGDAVLPVFQPWGLHSTQRFISLVTVQCWNWEEKTVTMNYWLINTQYVFGEYANLPVLDLETFVHALKVFYLFSAPGSFQVTHSLGWLQQPFSLALVEDLPGATPSLPKDSSNKNCSGFREQEF